MDGAIKLFNYISALTNRSFVAKRRPYASHTTSAAGAFIVARYLTAYMENFTNIYQLLSLSGIR